MCQYANYHAAYFYSAANWHIGTLLHWHIITLAHYLIGTLLYYHFHEEKNIIY